MNQRHYAQLAQLRIHFIPRTVIAGTLTLRLNMSADLMNRLNPSVSSVAIVTTCSFRSSVSRKVEYTEHKLLYFLPAV